MINRIYTITAITLVSIIILVFGILWTIRFFEIDKCLDLGGRWNYELNQCEKGYDIFSSESNDLYWHTEYDSNENYEYLEKGKLLDSISVTADNLIKILNRRNQKSKIEFIEISKDTIKIRILNDEYLTERMGTSGAFCYLGETVYTLTEHDSIEFVEMEFDDGSHASPGVYSRNDFIALIKK